MTLWRIRHGRWLAGAGAEPDRPASSRLHSQPRRPAAVMTATVTKHAEMGPVRMLATAQLALVRRASSPG